MSGSKSFRRLRIWVEYSAYYGVPIPITSVVPKRLLNSRSIKLLGTLKQFAVICKKHTQWLINNAKNACGMLVLWTVLPATVMILTMMYPFLRPAPSIVSE